MEATLFTVVSPSTAAACDGYVTTAVTEDEPRSRLDTACITVTQLAGTPSKAETLACISASVGREDGNSSEMYMENVVVGDGIGEVAGRVEAGGELVVGEVGARREAVVDVVDAGRELVVDEVDARREVETGVVTGVELVVDEVVPGLEVVVVRGTLVVVEVVTGLYVVVVDRILVVTEVVTGLDVVVVGGAFVILLHMVAPMDAFRPAGHGMQYEIEFITDNSL